MTKTQKRGQITLFILIAIVIVTAVLVFLLYVRPTYITPPNAQLQLQSCIENVVEEESVKLAKNAGIINPTNTITYEGEEVPYLCYTETYYTPCVNQYPFLKETFEESLKRNSKQGIEKCYEDELEKLRRQGNTISRSSSDFELFLEPDRVRVMMNSPTVSAGETSQTLLGSRIEVALPIYQMTIFATGIIQENIETGDSATDSYNLLYPEILLTKQKLGDETKIYNIKDKNSEINYRFALRSYAYPPGYGS